MFNWPIWLRNFTFNRLKDRFDKQREANEKQQKMLNNSKKKDIVKPNIPQSNYSTKATKK